jgi:phosphoglycerate dehydrogenase-like enzyme
MVTLDQLLRKSDFVSLHTAPTPQSRHIGHSPLALDNVVITTHSAFYSEQSVATLAKYPVIEVTRVMRGEWPSNLVNPQVQDKFKRRVEQD